MTISKNETAKKPVIICIDDERFVLDALNRQLQRKFGDAYEYEFSESAEEAMEVIDELAEKGYDFVMVICDQIMPGMTGEKFLTYVHKKFPKPIKILLTGQASLESAINLVNHADLYRYLSKPWKEDDFILTVEKGLQQYKLLEKTRKQAEVFSHFFPHEFLECLGKNSILDVKLGDHIKREMAVLFSDIRNFTTISENLLPEENYNFINSYLSYIEPAIQKNNGFIDKYIGDSVMALFYDPDDALKAAICMQQAITKFNQDHQEKKYYPISSGIGLHAGELMLGIVGVENRLQGTVIADAVNLASRLEGLTSIYASKIIVSEDVLLKLKDKYANLINRPLGIIKVKGRQKEVSVFEIIEPESDKDLEKKLLTKEDFSKGLELFFNQKFAEACICFQSVLSKNPADKAAKLYLSKSANYMVNGISEGWYVIEEISKGSDLYVQTFKRRYSDI